MKIVCTSQEKELLLYALEKSSKCPLSHGCPRDDKGDLIYPDCRGCLEYSSEIIWEVTEDKRRH